MYLLFSQIMQDESSYLHFRQGLKTLEQIFGQSLQIIVGQTPEKEEEKAAALWQLIRYTTYCSCFNGHPSIFILLNAMIHIFHCLYVNCRSLQHFFRKSVRECGYAAFPCSRISGYLLKSLGTIVPPWRLKAGTLLIVSIRKPEPIFKAALSALWLSLQRKKGEITVEKVVVV